MREERLPCAGAAGVIPGLRGRQMATDPGSLRPGQRGLDHQEVGVARELDDRVVGAAVRPERDPAAIRMPHVDREGEDVVRDLGEGEGERPDLDAAAPVVLLEMEGALDERLVSP